MYCGNCGTLIKENARFCGKCGSPAPVAIPPKVQQVVYVEEQPLTPILDDKAVVALTFCILLLSIVTIVISSAITRDVPSASSLKGAPLESGWRSSI